MCFGSIEKEHSLFREKHVPLVAGMIVKHFPSDAEEFLRGEKIANLADSESISLDLKKKGALKYVIHTKVGDGPRILDGEEHRLLDARGLPKYLL